MLLEEDASYLEQKDLAFTAAEESGHICVVIHDYPLPPGFDRDSTDVLVRLPAGYPDAAPDMFWCDPPVHRADGSFAPASEQMEQHVGRTWQRFSRHLSPGTWHPGTDRLASFLALIAEDLRRTGVG
jgi:hypothetical protein